MKSIQQLLRQPLKSILGLALLTLSGALFCIAAGQYHSAVQTRAEIDRQYTTVALTTSSETSIQQFNADNISVGILWLSGLPEETQAWLDQMIEQHPKLVKGTYQQQLASAYAPSITPLPIMQQNYDFGSATGLQPSRIAVPYTGAILEVTLEEIGEPYDAHYDWYDMPGCVTVDLVATVDRAVALNEGFTDPAGRTLTISYTAESQEALDAMALETGASYLVYGNDYIDWEWSLRLTISGDAPTDPIYEEAMDLDRLKIVTPKSEEMAPTYSWISYGSNVYYQTWNNQGDEIWYFLIPLLEARVNASAISAVDQSLLPQHNSAPTRGRYAKAETDIEIEQMIFEQYIAPQDPVYLPDEEYKALYQTPSLVRLEGSAEDFLASEDGALWRKMIDEMSICDHALAVLGTPKLGSVSQFAKEETVISSGRDFTSQEYAKGSRVCILSESLAAANGLSVGDTISLQFYNTDDNIPGQETNASANPVPSFYSSVLGFAGEPEDFTIVGLYRQSQEWVGDATSFLPNTVFVPEKALTYETRTANCGVFSTLVLQNGAIDQVQALAAEAGYEDLFVYFDQGYSAIGGSLDAYDEVARLILPVGVVAWAGILALFLVLFPARQRRDLARMLSIGAEPREARRHLLASSLGLAVPAAILGAVISSILQNRVAEKMMEAAELENPLELIQSPWVAPVLAVVQIALYGLVFYLFSLLTSHKLRGLMGEKAK